MITEYIIKNFYGKTEGDTKVKQNNKVLELLFYAVLAIVFIILFFVTKPYDRKPIPIFKPYEATVERGVNQYDAISVQP